MSNTDVAIRKRVRTGWRSMLARYKREAAAKKRAAGKHRHRWVDNAESFHIDRLTTRDGKRILKRPVVLVRIYVCSTCGETKMVREG